jgi:glutaredoxin
MAKSKIKLFTLSTCSHCKNAKKFFTENELAFEYVDVDLLKGAEKEKAMKDLDKIAAQRLFPTIVIGNIIIQGYKEEDIREALK